MEFNFRIFQKCPMEFNLSIGITTFEARFDKYFVPLISKLSEYNNCNEIIVTVNGENNRDFGEEYRKRILELISSKSSIYPIIFPTFRGLSKLWNSIIIHSTNDYVLILNDDTMITKPNYIEKIKKAIHNNNGKSFLINNSWSHFVVNKKEIEELGYFDERLLGIGEEDGDMTWRYIHKYGEAIKKYSMSEFVNYANETVDIYKPINIKCHSNTKYSLFNRSFMFTHKYRAVSNGIKGMFDYPVELHDPGPEQYPNEKFYQIRKNEL
jgi:hypothetical protein